MQRRHTTQKDLVLDAVATLMNHPTADEVYRYIVQNHPTVSRGTVFRNLKLLSEEGALRHIEMPGDADRYDHRLDAHFHLQCTVCGKTFDTALTDTPDLCRLIADTHGLEGLSYDIVFKGVCPRCKNKKG